MYIRRILQRERGSKGVGRAGIYQKEAELESLGWKFLGLGPGQSPGM